MPKTKVEVSTQLKGKELILGSADAGEQASLTLKGGGTDAASFDVEGVSTAKEKYADYVQVRETFGVELVTNGDFAAETDWGGLDGTDWQWDNVLLLAQHVTGNTTALTQAGVVIAAGKRYEISIDVAGTGVALDVVLGGVTEAIAAAGTFTVRVDAINTDGIAIVPDTNFDGTVTNVSVREVINAKLDLGDDGTVSVERDGDDLTFTDITTGTKTLAELAVVGTGDFKADGSVPMTGDLDMDGNDIDMGGGDLNNVGSVNPTSPLVIGKQFDAASEDIELQLGGTNGKKFKWNAVENRFEAVVEGSVVLPTITPDGEGGDYSALMSAITYDNNNYNYHYGYDPIEDPWKVVAETSNLITVAGAGDGPIAITKPTSEYANYREPQTIPASYSLGSASNLSAMLIYSYVEPPLGDPFEYRFTLVMPQDDVAVLIGVLPASWSVDAIIVDLFTKGLDDIFTITDGWADTATDSTSNPLTPEQIATLGLWGVDGAGATRASSAVYHDLKVGKIIGDGSELTDLPTLVFTEITETSGQMASGNGYIADNVAVVELTLPENAVVGDVVKVIGKGDGGWTVAQNFTDKIYFGNTNSTAGESGYIQSTHARDCVELVCVSSVSATPVEGEVEWQVVSAVGNLNMG